jgi:hypothetical protein
MTPLINNLKEENEHLHHLVAKLGDLLTATVNVLKGPPQENMMHSTHDIVEAAKALQQRLQGAEWALEAEQEAGRQLREEYGTGLRETAERQREACLQTLRELAEEIDCDCPPEWPRCDMCRSKMRVRNTKLVTDKHLAGY